MYCTANGYSDIINREMQFAVLSDLYYKMFNDDSKYFGIKINGEEWYEGDTELYYRYNNKPETIRLIAEENKNVFLYAVADAYSDKPKSWSPEYYFDLFLAAYDFLCDKEVSSPYQTEKDLELFEKKYGSKGYTIEHFEYIIGKAMHKVHEDEFLKEEYQDNVKSIRSQKTFESAIRNQARLFEMEDEPKEEFNEMVDNVIKAGIYEVKNILKDEESTYKENYAYLFESIFDFDHIEDTAFYDNDYLFFDHEGLSDMLEPNAEYEEELE